MSTKKMKKVMSEDQLLELESAEGALIDWRESVANKRVDLREAERDTREAQANLKNEKKQLGAMMKSVALTKKKLDKLKAKYKGWAKPKTSVGYANVIPSEEPGGHPADGM